MQKELIFPRGIRYPIVDEMPGGESSKAALRVAEARRSPVTQGYVRTNRPDGAGYTVIFEANVHAPDIWKVFTALVEALLPVVAAPIVGEFDEEPILGKYTTRDSALKVLEPYADMLAHDGFLEFGCIFQRGGHTEEVFVKSAKYLQVWTNLPGRTEAVFKACGIYVDPALRFIDNYPLTREPLMYAGEAVGYQVVLDELRAHFERLEDAPQREVEPAQ